MPGLSRGRDRVKISASNGVSARLSGGWAYWQSTIPIGRECTSSALSLEQPVSISADLPLRKSLVLLMLHGFDVPSIPPCGSLLNGLPDCGQPAVIASQASLLMAQKESCRCDSSIFDFLLPFEASLTLRRRPETSLITAFSRSHKSWPHGANVR